MSEPPQVDIVQTPSEPVGRGPHRRPRLATTQIRMPEQRRLVNGVVPQKYWCIASIGERIRRCRKQRGYSHRALAKLVGISQQSLWQIEAGKNNPSWLTLLRIADVLDAEVKFVVRSS